MRTWTTCSVLLWSTLLFISVITLTPPARAGDDAARALAERFAGGTGSQTENENQRKADEADMLERARSEAAAREAASRAAAMKENAAAMKEDAAAKQKVAAALKEIAAAAKERSAAAEAERVAAEQRTQQDAKNAADAAEMAASAAQQDRAREVSDLAEKLKRVRDARPAGEMGLGGPIQDPVPQAAITQDTAPAAANSADGGASLQPRQPTLPAASVRNATSVTVLLVMEPGTTGIRRGSKTADPVLCLDSWCYISNGAATPAKVMTRGAALGPINTLGLRAGACRHSLTCVYRGLDIAAYFQTGARQASLQPVDLRYLHHDRRQPMPLTVDARCQASGHELKCATAIKGKDWTAWIVPEELAVEAGVEALQNALDSGLADSSLPARAALLRPNR